MFPTKDRILAIIVLILGFFMLYSTKHQAQNVVKQGNTFVQTTVGDSIATQYYYQDTQGYKYPIFLSSKGKAYCWVRSKKSGKMYRKYLPKITELIKKEK